MLFRFFVYGLLGLSIEIVWTAFYDKAFMSKKGWDLLGVTSMWMFPIYGITVFLFEPIHNIIRNFSWYYRGLIYMVGIISVEFLIGYILKKINICPWDYSNVTSLNFQGLIRIDYGILWFVVGLLAEPIHDLLIKITPLIYSVF